MDRNDIRQRVDDVSSKLAARVAEYEIKQRLDDIASTVAARIAAYVTLDQQAIKRRLGVVAGILLVAGVVAVVGSASIPLGGGESVTIESHQPEAILAEPPAENGTIPVNSSIPRQTVVIDQKHQNPAISDSSPLVEGLVAADHSVTIHESGSIGEKLDTADGLVVVAPKKTYSEESLDSIREFAATGGNVLLVSEPKRVGAKPHTGMTQLASEQGLGFESGYLYNMETYNTNHQNVYAAPVDNGSLTDGVDQLTVATGHPVIGGSGAYETESTTVLSTTEREDSYTVVAQRGTVVAVGDRSLLTSEYAYNSDNNVFIGNLIEFLVS